MDSQSGDERPAVRLDWVLRNIDLIDGHLVFYSFNGNTIEPATIVVLVDEDIHTPPEGASYFLEVQIAKEVLRVWRSWRNGQEPNDDQACEALAYHAEYDAHLPAS